MVSSALKKDSLHGFALSPWCNLLLVIVDTFCNLFSIVNYIVAHTTWDHNSSQDPGHHHHHHHTITPSVPPASDSLVFGHFKCSEPVIMPLTECWPPWPFSLLTLLVFFSTTCCLWMIYFHSTAHKQSTRHIEVWIVARGLIFPQKIDITCWLFIFSLLQCHIASFSMISAVPHQYTATVDQ